MNIFRMRNRSFLLVGLTFVGGIFLVRQFTAGSNDESLSAAAQIPNDPNSFLNNNNKRHKSSIRGNDGNDEVLRPKDIGTLPFKPLVRSKIVGREPPEFNVNNNINNNNHVNVNVDDVGGGKHGKNYPDFGGEIERKAGEMTGDRKNVMNERRQGGRNFLSNRGRNSGKKAGSFGGEQRQKNYPMLNNGKFIPGHKIVHFDLKGAAPRVPYFKEVFKMISKLGGTGVLLEWEDMFPFTGKLAAIAQSEAYSKEDIKQILGWAVEYKLDIIPLVQTFGHLEYILKLPQFAKFRQAERYPQVICLGDEDAVSLVKEAIDQVMSLHSQFPMPFFHMGADEAFQIGMCELDQKDMREKLQSSRERLMLRHISKIAKYIKTKYDTNVLMWHDMLNNVDNEMIKEYDLGTLVEPVVWAYAENLNEYLMPDMWERFGAIFPNIWGGSSFKGADGPSRYYSNVPHYLQNHISWTQQMTREYRNFKEFRGLILTGWQRFDHFAILCEIFPVGIPSLAVNLKTIEKGVYDRSVLKDASDALGCSSTMDIDSMGVGAYCSFPGSKIYQSIQQLRLSLQNLQTQFYDDYQVRGWLSRFNIKHNYSQPWYLDQLQDKLSMYQQDIQSIARSLRDEMPKVFWPDTVDEWIYEYLEPDLDRLNEMSDAIQRLGSMKTFPMRPFPIRGSTSLWKSPLSNNNQPRHPMNHNNNNGGYNSNNNNNDDEGIRKKVRFNNHQGDNF